MKRYGNGPASALGLAVSLHLTENFKWHFRSVTPLFNESLAGSLLLHKHRFYSITRPAPLLEAEKHVQPLTHRHTAFSE